MENFGAVRQLGATERTRFLARTYGWMAAALVVSAVSAFVSANAIVAEEGGMLVLTAFGRFMFAGGRIGMWIFLIGEVLLVWWLSASIRKISEGTAAVAFFVYSVVNGVTLSTILFAYQLGSIASTFLGAAAMFGVMSVYGAKTTRDLSSFGRHLSMALIGLVVASVINVVVSMVSGTPLRVLDFLISLAGVAIFTGLAAYDTQKLVRLAEQSDGSADFRKVSIIAALDLYLDFINIFLFLLRLFGRRK